MLPFSKTTVKLARICFPLIGLFIIIKITGSLYEENIDQQRYDKGLETTYLESTAASTTPAAAFEHQVISAHNEVLTKKLTKKRKNEILPLVLYNRVGKCASSVMQYVIKQQKRKMNFTVFDINLPHIKKYGDYSMQAEMVIFMKKLPAKTILIRHLHFLDFDNFHSSWPIYINVIRDPIDRFISYYYYVRNGAASAEGKINSKWRKNLSEEERNMHLDTCMAKDPHSCVSKTVNTFLAFFCGQEQKCRNYSSEYPLKKAKLNVEKHYLSVGLTEDLTNTLKVFGALLPEYFSGSHLVSLAKETEKTKTYNRPQVANHTRELLSKVLRYEIDFYEFVKKRFYKQLHYLTQLRKIL